MSRAGSPSMRTMSASSPAAMTPQSAILAVGAEESLSEEHADRHRGHEEQGFRSESAQIGKSWAGAEPAQASADAKNCGSDDEAAANRRRRTANYREFTSRLFLTAFQELDGLKPSSLFELSASGGRARPDR